MRKSCKHKRCPNLAVVGGAYCLSCRRRWRRMRSSRAICRDWSIYALPTDVVTAPTQIEYHLVEGPIEIQASTVDNLPTPINN